MMRLPTSEEAKRLAAVMHRRLTTGWTPKEVKAMLDRRKEGCFKEKSDLDNLERFYAANWPPDRDKNHLRHDLLTLLNHLQGEFGKAEVWVQRHPVRSKIIPMPLLKSDAPIVDEPQTEEEKARHARFLSELAERKRKKGA